MSFFTKIFGGSRSKQQSESNNQAYPFIKDQLGGTIGQTGGASSAIAAMLGLGGDAAGQRASFDRFKDSAGYSFLMDSGRDAIIGNNASKGLFRSGSTGKSLMQFGQNLGQTMYGDYMDRLLGLGNMGIQAANTVTGAGQQSKSTGSSSNDKGIGGFLGTILASERHLKDKINKLGELEDGLGIYSYEYKDNPGIMYIGAMVDEVEELRPWAVADERTEAGDRMVDYSKLGGNA